MLGSSYRNDAMGTETPVWIAGVRRCGDVQDDYYSEDEADLPASPQAGRDYSSSYPITALSEFINNNQRRARRTESA